MVDPVCRFCGVDVGTTKTLRLIHLGEIPRGFDEHEIEATSRVMYEQMVQRRSDLKIAAADMLVHHSTLHPIADCQWGQRLSAALRNS